jgi:hypothetical protein
MVERYGLDSILSFDRDFDRVPDLVREEPDDQPPSTGAGSPVR